ncbi:MAG TPA: MFS transporter [Candidatus Paceibacterota bacterium]|mgnify:FL=1|nr:MFS transporter [Candidatus Paceibacterota bacterium]
MGKKPQKILKLNEVIRKFIISDLILFSGWGFISPLMSIFIVQEIGGNLINVGVSVAIYWFVRSIIELPLANRLDRTRGEKDDFYALISGLFVVAISAFCYTVVRNVEQLYLFKLLEGIGFAMYASSWSGIFSRHLDKDRIAFSWSADHIAIGIASALGGILGGLSATLLGFRFIFIFGGILSLVSAIIMLSIPKIIFPKSTTSDQSSTTIDHSVKNTT